MEHNMKYQILLSLGFVLTAGLPATSMADGDPAKGEKDFRRCTSCHSITATDGTVIMRGGRTGPNLYGVVGRGVGAGDFKYSEAMAAAGAAGLVWDNESLATYVADPSAWLQEQLDDPKARSSMTFKLRKGGADMAAYLATLKD